jgi:hypothetical protein
MKIHINKKYLRRLKWLMFISIFMIGIILLFLPKEYFDEGQSVCLSVVIFDVKCYGCGMTRAIQHLLHLDFKTAIDYNMLSVIVFPLLIFMILKEFYSFLKEDK